MSESVERESQDSVSDDETQDSPSPPKETMEVDVDGDTLSETQESDTNDNKENKNKSSNKPSKKRKNTSPDTDTNNPKKKRKISKDNKNNKNNETDKKQHKKRRAGRPPKKDIDVSGDSTMERKKRKSIVRDLKDSIPQYLQLSDDENDNNNNNNNKNKNKKNKEKSNRLLKQQQALMTQEPNDMESDDIMDSDDENEVKQREKNIKHLCDVKLEEIQLLSTQTIHRLCNRHKIVIHKPLNATELEEKQKCEEEKKKYRRVYDDSKYISNKKLVKELKREKKILDKEININNLDDVKKKRDIGEFKRDTIVRLCKHHRIQANQKLMKMIQCLEDRWENPSDEDDHIETLKDIKDIDEIQHLSREVLIRLCNAHGVQTVKKKKKKKKRKKKKKGDDSDSDSDSDDDDDDDNDDDDDVIDLLDEELIKALEDIKKKMNEAKHKKQKSQIEKLELMQENMLNIGFRDNYLTVSGDENFKDKCRNLIAVCNSEVTNKSLCYDLVDDELGQYKVCVSESGARTIKVMMTVARGGSIVNDKWISHSIKGKRWANPQNYEKEFGNWKNAAEKYRDSVIKKRKRTKKDKDGDNDMNSSDSEKEIATSGPLLSDYSIYVQDRPSKIKPSSLSLKHLAWNAGAQIVNQNWKNERLKKKEVNDGLDDEKDESDSDQNRNNKNSNKKSSKKSSRKSSKKTSKRKKKKDDSDDDDDEYDDDSDNDSDNDSGNDKEEAGDEDSDIEENKNKNKNKKRRKKTKDSGKKKKKIKASRSIREDSGKKKRKTVLRKYKLIISHPAIYKDLPKEMKKNKNDIFIVGQKWLFESIENFTIEDEENYIVKPNKNRSRSPAH